MARGEMRCKCGHERGWHWHRKLVGEAKVHVDDCGFEGCSCSAYEPAAVPESAIEPEPQREIEITLNDPSWLHASSAIEVAPRHVHGYPDCDADLPGETCPFETMEWGDGKARPLSVAPGEAQREGECPACDRTNPSQGFCSSCAVPSEVAPSREKRLEDALRDALAENDELVKNAKSHVDVQDAAYLFLCKMRAGLEAK